MTLKQNRLRAADMTSTIVHLSMISFLFAKQLNNNFSKRWKTKAEEKIVPRKLILLYSLIESYTKERFADCANPSNLACLKRAK